MISLWICKNAIYPDKDHEYIWCSKGHDLGTMHPRMAQKGKPLICMTCQECPDADIMGGDIKKRERGWK